jgi:hypothetical protein
MDACFADKGDPDAGIDIPCLSPAGDGTGQYEQFITCMESFRTKGSVAPQDAVTSGDFVLSCSPQTCAWPPTGMTAATADLINCMATNKTNTSCSANCPNDNGLNNSWATPGNGFTWPAASCAKTNCTSFMP